MHLLLKPVAVGLLMLAGIPLQGQTQQRSDANPEITTVGRGEIRVAPDRATVLIMVETHASSAAAASSSNSQITSATITAVKSATSSADVVTTQSYSVTPDYEKGKPKGFGARNTVRVELHDIARLGQVIDVALSSGATQIYQVQFTASTASGARRKALRLAVSEARLDAEALAEAAGGTVGRLLSMNSSLSGFPILASYDMFSVRGGTAMGGSAAPPPMLPDNLTVTAIATARWEFIPKRAP